MSAKAIILCGALLRCVFVLAQAQPGITTNRVAGTNSAPLASTPAVKGAATNAPYKIPENQILVFYVPLSPSAQLAVVNSKNPFVDHARVGVAVPTGFDPEIPTPLLLVSGTSERDGSSIRAMQSFTNVALRLGWVVLAADGPEGKPLNDTPPWRWAMTTSLLEHVNKTWPGAKRWPLVSAGVSGGGKWAGLLAAILAQKDYNLIGLFMGAINEDIAGEASKVYDPAVRFRETPVYLSSGTDDKLATPEQHQQVKESMLSNGFTHVRLESFKGGHALSEGQLRTALTWFIEFYGKESPDPK